MSNEEIELMNLTGELANKFFSLEQEHSHDVKEFVFHIHAIQNIILSREGIRQYRQFELTDNGGIYFTKNKA
jgi:hypothetical protein